MNIFAKDTDMKDRLEAASTEVDELTELVKQREADIVTLTEQVAELSAGLEQRINELEESNAACALLETEKDAVAAELTESKEAQVEFDEKVAAAALAKMQEIGVDEPVEEIKDDGEVDLYTKYTKLKATDPAEAGAFWRENEAAIKAAL